jgi:hypothetical protein
MPVSQRSQTLAERLGFELVLLGRQGYRRPWTAPLEYPLLALRTVHAVLRRRPRRIVVVAPPVFAPLVVVALAWLSGASVAIDIHSGAVLDRRWRWTTPLLRGLARRAAAAVVTLPSLHRFLAGAPTIVLADPLPDLHTGDAPRTDPDLVVAVCGWADDEPLDELVRAAAGQPWRLLITGRPRRTLSSPPNVEVAGFLDEDRYARTLGTAAAVVVLTTRDETLLSGAWEAIALRRPLVVSGTPALRATFGPEVSYADPTAESIAEAIGGLLADPRAAHKAQQLERRWRERNDAALNGLRRHLGLELSE